MLRLDGHRRAVLRLALDDVVPPVVAPRDHVDAIAKAVDDDDVLDRRAVGDGLVGVVLEVDLVAATVAAVGRDQDLCPAVIDPPGQRLGGEATEYDRVRGADPGAGQHRDRQLGDHRHVDGDAVALLDAELLEGVRGLRDLPLQVGEGQRARVARLTDPVVGHLVAEPALHVPIDAVVGDVELPTREPLRERQVPLEGRLERLRPVDPLACELRPEALEVAFGLVVEPGRCVGLGGELR